MTGADVGSGLSAVLRAVVLAAVALGIWFLSNYESQPHWQNYAAKPATDFSATRADATLARILGPKEIPDPVGSAHNAEVRANIQKEFAAIGVKTTAYKAFTCNAWRGFSFIACATYCGRSSGVSVPFPRGMRCVMQPLPAGSHARSSGSMVVLFIGTINPMRCGHVVMTLPR